MDRGGERPGSDVGRGHIPEAPDRHGGADAGAANGGGKHVCGQCIHRGLHGVEQGAETANITITVSQARGVSGIADISRAHTTASAAIVSSAGREPTAE